MGYKGVLCYNCSTQRFVISRHVIYDEFIPSSILALYTPIFCPLCLYLFSLIYLPLLSFHLRTLFPMPIIPPHLPVVASFLLLHHRLSFLQMLLLLWFSLWQILFQFRQGSICLLLIMSFLVLLLVSLLLETYIQ